MSERPAPKPAPLRIENDSIRDGDATQAFSVAEINRALLRIDEIDTRTRRHKAPVRKGNISWQAALVMIVGFITATGLAAWIVFLVVR